MALSTLHPRQVLVGCLTLLAPACRRPQFQRHLPLAFAAMREAPSSEKWNRGREIYQVEIFPKFRFPRKFRNLLHTVNLRHGIGIANKANAFIKSCVKLREQGVLTDNRNFNTIVTECVSLNKEFPRVQFLVFVSSTVHKRTPKKLNLIY